MIIEHVYKTDYAGLNPEKQLCQHVTPGGLTCMLPPEKHAHRRSRVDDDALADIERQQFEAGIDADVDMVNSPPHYTSHPSGVEAIEIGRHLTADWFNAFKYVFRADLKNGKQDIEKALWYAKDAGAHDIMMHAPSWGSEQVAKIHKVIDTEPNALRKIFYVCVEINSPVVARNCIEAMIQNWPS